MLFADSVGCTCRERNMKDGLRRIFLYGGLEREDYEQIREDIAEHNRKCLSVTNFLALGLMIASVVMSLVLPSVDSSLTVLCACCLFVDVVMLIASRYALKRDRSMITPYVWVCIVMLYSYAVMTTVINPENQATTMMVCLAIIPVIFALRPSVSICVTVAVAISFDCIVVQVKEPVHWEPDLWNSVVFGIVGIVAGTESTAIKFRSFSLARKNCFLFENDLLTGVRSRNSYEEHCDEFLQQAEENVICIFADVNGLHEVNNQKGHAAGDRMLQTVAGAMAEAFGRDRTFRFGGDEFVSIVFDTPLARTAQMAEAVQKKLAGEGYFVSCGMAERPAGKIDSDRMLMEAEKKMREAKARFYSTPEHSRRARLSENSQPL